MVNVKIPIVYREDPAAYDEQTYIYEMQLGPDNKQDYLTGKLIGLQMEAIANSVQLQLPQSAMIDSVNHHDINPNMPLSQFIESLKRHDDYFSVLLFDKNNLTVPQSQIIQDIKNNTNKVSESNKNTQQSNQANSNQQPSNQTNMNTQQSNQTNSNQQPSDQTMPSDNSQLNQATDQKSPETNMPTNTKQTPALQVLHVQKVGHRSYNPIDISTGKLPDDNDMINQIGMSRINRLPWSAIKDLVLKHKDVIFDNPVMILPDNASVTALRRKKVANDSGLDESDLKDSTEEPLGTFINANHYFKIIAFILKQDEASNTMTYDTDLSQPDESDINNTNAVTNKPTTINDTLANNVPNNTISNINTQESDPNMTESTNNQSINDIINLVNNSNTVNKQILEKLETLNTQLTKQKEDISDLPKEVIQFANTNDPKQRAQNVFTFLDNVMNTVSTTNPISIAYVQQLLQNPSLFLKAIRYLGTIDVSTNAK